MIERRPVFADVDELMGMIDHLAREADELFGSDAALECYEIDLTGADRVFLSQIGIA